MFLPQLTNPLKNRREFVGASSDFSHILFESHYPLTPDATAGVSNVYEYFDGAVRLASVLPNGTGAGRAQAGLGAGGLNSPHYAYTPHLISEDGSRVFFSRVSDGSIYMRTNGTNTVEMNESERTEPASPQPADLWTASADGSKAFFTTSESLVDNDSDGFTDLYMYRTAASSGNHLSLLSLDQELSDYHEVTGVVGVSDDGRYVYFTANGQLAAGQPTDLLRSLFVWHDGAVRFIGTFSNDEDDDNVLRHGAGWSYINDAQGARIAPDGRHLLFKVERDEGFRGRGGFGGYDHGAGCALDFNACATEFYLYSYDSGRLRCATCNPVGQPAQEERCWPQIFCPKCQLCRQTLPICHMRWLSMAPVSSSIHVKRCSRKTPTVRQTPTSTVSTVA